MNGTSLLDYFLTRQPIMLDAIRQLVEIETPSDDKPRLDAFARLLRDRLMAAGAQAEIIPNPERGDHVRATFGPALPGVKPALILCHFDTVWSVGSLATHPFRVDAAGKAYGPGIFDMQSSLVLTEYALRAIGDLALELPRPITILMTSDEEVGSPTSKELIENEARQAAYVLVMESPLPGGVLKTARKGGRHFHLSVQGVPAHAGVEPEKGISAIQELAQQILILHSLTDLQKGTTVNVGVVSGGSRANVVAARAEAQIDVRAWTQVEMERISEAILSVEPITPGAQVTVTASEGRPPLESTVTLDLFHQAQTLGRELGLELDHAGTGGGSDGNLTGALGIPTLDGLGVPGHGAHADHEHIETDKIAGRAALLTTLLLQL